MVATDFDIAVVGLGAMGSMALWQITRLAPHDSIIGIERFEPGHDKGSSHGGSRIFRRTVFEGSHYVPLASRALELWDELDKSSTSQLRVQTGGLTIGATDSDFLNDAQRAAQAGGAEVELLSREELRARFPQHALFSDDCGLFEPNACVLHPEHSIRAAVESATHAGATLLTDAHVTSLAARKSHCVISTSTHTITARRVIVAAGAWSTQLLPDEHIPIRVQRTVPVHFRTSADRTHDYGPQRFPLFIRDSRQINLWGIPDVDGRGVKIGVKNAQKPWLAEVEHNWTPARPSDIAPVIEACAQAIPELADAQTSGHPCMNARTPDGQFIIGPAQNYPNITVLAGFGGQGFKYAPAIGELGALLALDSSTETDISAFSPKRLRHLRWGTPATPLFQPTEA